MVTWHSPIQEASACPALGNSMGTELGPALPPSPGRLWLILGLPCLQSYPGYSTTDLCIEGPLFPASPSQGQLAKDRFVAPTSDTCQGKTCPHTSLSPILLRFILVLPTASGETEVGREIHKKYPSRLGCVCVCHRMIDFWGAQSYTVGQTCDGQVSTGQISLVVKKAPLN